MPPRRLSHVYINMQIECEDPSGPICLIVLAVTMEDETKDGQDWIVDKKYHDIDHIKCCGEHIPIFPDYIDNHPADKHGQYRQNKENRPPKDTVTYTGQ